MTCPVQAPMVLSYVTTVLSILICLVIVTGNFIIIFAVIKDPLKKLHTPFNYFLVNLAVSDFMVGVVTMPISAYVHYSEAKANAHPNLIFVLHMSYFISATCSFLSMIALSVDRYFAVTLSVQYRYYLNWSKCLGISMGIWILSLLFPLMYLKLGYIKYLMIYANSAIVIGSVVFVMTYLKIYTFLHSLTSDVKNRTADEKLTNKFYLMRLETEKKVTRIFLLILMAFVLLYIPVIIMVYILHFCNTCNCDVVHSLRDSQFLIVCINSGINPLICTMRLKQFNSSIKYLFRGKPPMSNSDSTSGTVTMANVEAMKVYDTRM